QLFSLLGSSIVQYGIIWWITDSTGSAIYLSLAAFFSFLPMVIISPIAGVYIDRWNRKLTILVMDSLQATVTFFLILAFFFNISEVWIVISLNAIRGICQAFHFPAVHAIIPLMVPKKHLSRINGANYLLTGIINSIGPAIGAYLYKFSIEFVLSVDIITFFIALVPLIMIKIPDISPKKEEFSFKKDFKLGVKVLKSVPALLILLILISAINLLSVPFNTLMPLFIKSIHNGNEDNLALVLGLINMGMVIGSAFSIKKRYWKHKVKTILLGIIISAGGYFIATISPTGFFFMVGIGGLIRAAMIPVINTNFLTIIQTNVSSETQGRVMSIVIAIASAVSPIGMILSGPLAELIGIIPLFLICATLDMVCVVIVWFFTGIRKVKYEKQEED
ncbi:MAG: MFS transporter, partial [Candidatus Lokiarchaeota archaeon]|nr:MFS transporter [Candidatus Lokiarchaeota archaeon]